MSMQPAGIRLHNPFREGTLSCSRQFPSVRSGIGRPLVCGAGTSRLLIKGSASGVSVELSRPLFTAECCQLACKAGVHRLSVRNARATSGVAYFILLQAEHERRPGYDTLGR